MVLRPDTSPRTPAEQPPVVPSIKMPAANENPAVLQEPPQQTTSREPADEPTATQPTVTQPTPATGVPGTTEPESVPPAAETPPLVTPDKIAPLPEQDFAPPPGTRTPTESPPKADRSETQPVPPTPMTPASPPAPSVAPTLPSQAEQPAPPAATADTGAAEKTPAIEPPDTNTQTQPAGAPTVNQIPPVTPLPGQSPGDKKTDVSINIPKPDVPAKEIGDVAQRISWLRDYSGGNCFYATALSATDKAIDIEGFGTGVEPFMQMLKEFQSHFDMEPDINVRLIDPAQCEVTEFLRQLGEMSSDRPDLTLDRTSVPSGTPISGALQTRGGLRSNLLLIDHKGMAFNLDQRIRVEAGRAVFNIPIGLSSADQASGKVVPQIILAVTADRDIDAADFSKPTPASIVLPKILAEVRDRGLEGAATAKYFRLGG